MAQASTSRLGICQTCNTTPARYSCPACSFPSCSLACSTSHKTAKDCTGIAPPVWSRPIQANEMNWGSLMRDQSYIAGVGRAIEEVGKQLVGDKLIPQGRRLGADETVRLDERSEKEDKMVREARNQGVELMLLPKGMSKRQKNGTRWDPKKRQLEWTVEVSFLPRPSTDRSAPSQPPSIVATYPVPSVNTLKSVINDAFSIRDKKGKGKAVDPEEATWRLAQKEWLESFKASEKAVEEVQGQESMEQTAEETETKDQGEEPVEDLPEDGEVPQTDEVEGAEPEAGGQQDEAPTEPAQPDVAPPEEGEARSEAVAPASPARSPPSRVAPPADDDSPFVLLLSFHARPIYPDSAPDGTQTTPSPSKTPSRSVYQLQLTPSLTLRDALAGSTLLENPCFEIWPRETFLRQKLLGKIKVVEQPAELRVRERTGVWERGRGRGRGSSRGGPSDRGTFNPRGRGRGRGGGGSYEGRSHEGGGHSNPRSEGRWDDRRSQDSGWGKRGNGDDRSGDTKRPRND
ncbi:hypothetical protein JCM16303_007221 [Sporobolomyces ruberrimus]